MVEFEQENVYWVICKFPSYSNDTVKTTESDFSNKHLFKLNINSFMTEVPIWSLYGLDWFLYDRDLRHERIENICDIRGVS